MAAAPAQAQDEIFVDDGGNDSQAGDANNPVRTLQEAINTRVDEDGDKVIVRGGDYTVNSTTLNVNYGIEIEFTEAADGATVADFDGDINFNPAVNGTDSEVDINSTNGGSLEFSAATTFELQSGNVNIDASSTVVLADEATINRGNGSDAPSLNNSGPTFGASVNVNYNTGSAVTSGPELPSDGDLGSGNLNVLASTVTFDQSVDASEFGLADGAVADFQTNDLTAGAASGAADVAGAASGSGAGTDGEDVVVGSSSELTVGGTLTIENDDVALRVDGDLNQNGTVGDVTFDGIDPSNNSGNVGGTNTNDDVLIDGSGAVDIGTATFTLAATDGDTDDDVFNTAVRATGDASFTVNTVTTNSATGSDDTDDLLVDLNAGGNEASFTVTSGSDFGAITIDNPNARLDIDGGITSTGAVDNAGTTDIEGAATLASGGGSINNSGTIDVKAAATLGGGSSITNTGSIINTGTVNITASGATLDASGSNIENGSGTIDADVDATLVGAVNNETGGSDGQVDVAGGSTVTINTGSGNVTHTGSESNANGFTGDGTVTFETENGNNHRINGGNFSVSEVNADADLTVGASDVDVGGVFDANAPITVNGADLRIDGNARFDGGSIAATGGSPSLTFGGTSSATLFPGNTFDFDGDVTFAKTSATSSPIVTLNNSIRIEGNVTVNHNDLTASDDDALDLGSHDIFLDGASSTFTLQGASSEREIAGTGRVVFENTGTIGVPAGGSGGYGNIAVLNVNAAPNTPGSNEAISFDDTGADIKFFGTLELAREGLDTSDPGASGVDISPATGAEVKRVVGGTGTSIGENTEIIGGNFNGDGNEYELTYGQNGGESVDPDASNLTDTGSEFTGNVTDVTVEEGAGVDLDNNESVGGVLTVDGQLASENGNNLNLSTANNTHVVTGALTDNNSNHTNLRATAAGVTVNGYSGSSGPPAGGDDAVLGPVVVTNGNGLTINGIKKIKSTVNLNSGSNNTSLDIGLATDGDLSDNELLTSDAQSIAGVTNLNGGTATNSLTLSSDVTALSNVNAGEASISLGSNDLLVADADFLGTAPTFSASGGFLIMEDAGSTSDNGFLGTGGNTIPNLRTTVDDASGTVDRVRLSSNVDVSGTLDIEIEIGGNGNTLTFSNSGDDKAILDASEAFSGGSAVFRAEGTEIEARTDASISNFSVSAPNGETVTLTSDSDGPYNVDVDNLQLDGGTLAHEGNNVDITTDGGGPFGSNGFIVTSNFDPSTDAVTSSEGGYIRFDNSGGVTTSLSSGGSAGASAITIDRLRVINGGGDLTDSDDRSLTIAEELSLNQKLAAPSDDNDNIEVNGSALVKKTNDTDVLDEQLTFNGSTYDLTYASGIGSNIDAEDELTTSSSVTIGTLRNNSGQTITFGNNNTEGVTAENLILESGTIDYNNNSDRLITIADGGTVERVDGDLETNDLEASGSFTLTYRPTSGNIDLTSGSGGDEEFTSAVSTLRFVDTDGNASDDNLTLNENKTVDVLEVDRSDGSSQFALNGNVLTVDGEAELTAGEVTGGTLDSDGTGGTLGADSDSDVLISGTLSSSLEAEGNVEIDGGSVSDVEFDGQDAQSLDGSDTVSPSAVTLDQSPPSSGDASTVSVNDGNGTLDVGGKLTLNGGVLVADEVQLADNTLSRDPAAGQGSNDFSHVAAALERQVTTSSDDNLVRVNYPVGTENPEFRRYRLDFPDGAPIETDVTVEYREEQPAGTEGLPATDNTGVTIGTDIPSFQWRISADQDLTLNPGEYQASVRTSEEDLALNEPVTDHRLIVRDQADDPSNAPYSIVGTGDAYNISGPTNGAISIRSEGAGSDITELGTVFTVGVPAGDAPQIATNSGLTVTQDESGTIGQGDLEASNGDPAGLTYTVTSGPSQGEIQVDGSQSSTFTQADVNNELVSYNHTASSSDNDSFKFEVENSDGLTASGTFDITVEAGQVAISGSVNYPTVSNGSVVDGRALEGVEVEATSGDVTETATTDADGNFTIGGLDSGDYEVTANVDRDVSNVSIGDAQRTVSGFAGTEPFAGAFQEEVADVNASGTANATDALRIAFFDLGSISSFEAGSFLVDTTEVTLGTESESGVSIRVAEFGDADLSGGSSDSGGSTSLATTTVSPKSSAQTAAKSATESAGDANRVAAGETFEVPVRVDRGAEVGSYSLSLEYDTEKATFEGISSGRDDIITNGSKEDGTLQVGWFDRSGESTLELTGGSELVTLRFSAAEGVEGAEFAPEITSGEINGPGAKAVAAGVETQAVRIAKPAPDEFALNGSYPNPASQQATVEMDLPVRAQVTVEVYNTLGQRVQTVEQSMSAGAGQTVQLDASQLASGQYFYRVKASLDGNQTRETGRLTIVK
ncbi:cadherin-like domain-containing protein [Salinibacter ruber]|uniref:cadherin-like domain-containing protein n=1 Tax=Salinibacter ruber TaxID=146919 RepID=UPI002166C9F5|nr:cadherin-like domain-containing protein [Salinibacter ruber]MCS4198338.1 hypothetical protein [Salinibacter ruber]